MEREASSFRTLETKTRTPVFPSPLNGLASPLVARGVMVCGYVHVHVQVDEILRPNPGCAHTTTEDGRASDEYPPVEQ